MPRDGAQTRARIVDRASHVFNRRGYFGTSLTDLLDATGLEKGGLYHHFGSKEALALEAFEHAVDLVRKRFRTALAAERHAIARLHAIVDVWVGFVEDPPLPGGCPILNTVVDADGTQTALRRRSRAVMSELLDGTVARVVERGLERNEIAPDTDPESVAALIVAAGEGGIVLARLYPKRDSMRRIAAQLHALIDTMAVEERS